MTSLKLTVPLEFTDADLPILTSDPMLRAGSLALIEPANPINPWPAGVPAAGYQVPNLAAKQTRALIGVAGDATFINGGFTDPASGKLERTGKGGLHGLISQAKDASTHTSTSAGVTLSEKVWDYVAANQGHAYYASIWHRTTRGPISGKFPVQALLSSGSTTANYLYSMQNSTRPAAAYTDSFVGARGTMGDTSPALRNVGVKRVTGAMDPATATASKSREFGWGRFRQSGSGFYSWVFYRYYLEDLTVSGRTYAEADAADLALASKAFGAGGRYAGDTFTDPAALP